MLNHGAQSLGSARVCSTESTDSTFEFSLSCGDGVQEHERAFFDSADWALRKVRMITPHRRGVQMVFDQRGSVTRI